MRICVIGDRGMLGHVVKRLFIEGRHTVLTVEERYNPSAPQKFARGIAAAEADFYINCLAVTTATADPGLLSAVNADFPLRCMHYLPRGAGFIHASSDAVFRSDVPSREASEAPDAVDPYGLSKAEGDVRVREAGGVVIRTSIVGPPSRNGRGLIGWLLTQAEDVRGFVNQRWNGITTLEWARVCRAIVERPVPARGIAVQPTSWPPTTKCELLVLVSRAWQTDRRITPVPADQAILRTLVPNYAVPPLPEQLDDMVQWYYSRSA